MGQFHENKDKFLVAVDCVIFGFLKGELNLLLIRRALEPGNGLWSVMGGFLNANESIDDAAKRILKELTGLDNIYMEQVKLHGEIYRDTGGRVLSQVYYALIDIDTYNRQLVADHDAHWVSITKIPTLIFDHLEMVKEALVKLRLKSKTEPIGLNLLPEFFALPQLQALYEAIYNEKYDKRNFRKRVSSFDFIEKTDKIDKSGSKRGAVLYQFNINRYKKMNNPKMEL